MGWFRRNKQRNTRPQPRDGLLIDWEHYLDQIESGTRLGLPHDGRHWIMMADSYPDEMRLLWEKAATHREAKQALKNLEAYCRTPPRLIYGGHFDDVDGMWSAPQPKRTTGLLNIWHPSSIGRTAKSREQPPTSTANDQQIYESVLSRHRALLFPILSVRRVEHGSYDPEFMRQQLSALKMAARPLEHRGHDLSSFWEMMSQAESALLRGSQFSGEAHRFGYGALLYLGDGRSAGGGKAPICALTPSGNYAQVPDECYQCGRSKVDLKFCEDFLCVDCLAGQVALLWLAEPYWTAPNDNDYVERDYQETVSRAYDTIARHLSVQ